MTRAVRGRCATKDTVANGIADTLYVGEILPTLLESDNRA